MYQHKTETAKERPTETQSTPEWMSVFTQSCHSKSGQVCILLAFVEDKKKGKNAAYVTLVVHMHSACLYRVCYQLYFGHMKNADSAHLLHWTWKVNMKFKEPDGAFVFCLSEFHNLY